MFPLKYYIIYISLDSIRISQRRKSIHRNVLMYGLVLSLVELLVKPGDGRRLVLRPAATAVLVRLSVSLHHKYRLSR